jgi:hypothetical protein
MAAIIAGRRDHLGQPLERTDYPKARDLADRYDIPLVSVNRDTVLTAAR